MYGKHWGTVLIFVCYISLLQISFGILKLFDGYVKDSFSVTWNNPEQLVYFNQIGDGYLWQLKKF